MIETDPYCMPPKRKRLRGYVGITYKAKWKPNCKDGKHILDEVASGSDHYLHCDNCGLEIYIKKILKPKK